MRIFDIKAVSQEIAPSPLLDVGMHRGTCLAEVREGSDMVNRFADGVKKLKWQIGDIRRSHGFPVSAIELSTAQSSLSVRQGRS